MRPSSLLFADLSLNVSDSSGCNVKFDSKSDAEVTAPTPTVQFGLKLSQMGLSLSSPNLRTATSLFSSSDSDEGSTNESFDKSKTEPSTNNEDDEHRRHHHHHHHNADEFTLLDANEETISGENDVEYAEFSMVHQVPAHVATAATDGINETGALNEEMMFLRLFDDLQPQGAAGANDRKKFSAPSKSTGFSFVFVSFVRGRRLPPGEGSDLATKNA